MPADTTEREQALRWLIAHRRPSLSIEQAVRLLCEVLPRDHQTLQVLRRIADEALSELEAGPTFKRPRPAGSPPRGGPAGR